ncbi:MAG: hypothetical protein H6656_02100 [Ardenticatenaceae bacterium]|nr:hypothetical protein [Ardenticatenaceae bacterium]
MNLFLIPLIILGFGTAILGLLILLKHPFVMQYIEPTLWGSLLGLGIIISGLVMSWSTLALLFNVPGVETANNIGGILLLFLSIMVGIGRIIGGRPFIVEKIDPALSKRQSLFSGIFIIAIGVTFSFGMTFKDYFNLTPNQESVVFGVLMIVAVIPLTLFGIVRYVENVRQ